MADENEKRQDTAPHDTEAEESVLGSVLLHPACFSRIAPLVAPQDFFHPIHRRVFEAFVELEAIPKPIDMLLVADNLRDSFDKITPERLTALLVELQNKVVSLENVEQHAKMIADHARVRRLADACREIAAKAYGRNYETAEEFVASAERAFYDARGKGDRRGPRRLYDVMKDVVKSVEVRFRAGDRPLGVPTGFPKHDALTAGLQPGDLIIIAARPSMGKSSYAGNIVVNAADVDIPSLVFSLEMSDQAVGERMVAARGNIDSQHLRTGRMTTDDWKALSKASSELAQKNVYIDDSGDTNVLQMRATARRWRAEQTDPDKLGIIVVDYLQLVAGSGKEDNRQAEVAFISRNLKLLAKELRVPVVALSQLNRKVEERSDKRPQMSDLRESGAVEQDADLIEFIYRDEVYHADTKYKGIAEVNVAKQRMGPTGVIMMRWRPSFTRFDPLEEQRDPGADDD